MTDTVLEFQQVAVEGGHLYDTAIWQVSFRLQRSELMLVRLEPGHLSLPLADAAQGIVEPIQGRVSFLGERWSALSEEAKLAARAKIGRVFDEPGWISELDIDDNITLSQRHHTQRLDSAIRDEASELARRFSLPGLPQGKPSDMRAPDLRRAACVRAFLGLPELLILERPTAGVYPDIMPPLMASVRAARSRGATVLWTTDHWEVWNDPGIKPTIRCAMTGSQMSFVSGYQSCLSP
jgi:phospholipid/cholesterol/gamma-HCH transport system ATP-binding protein